MLSHRLVAAAFTVAAIVACAPVRGEVPTIPVNTDFNVAIGGLARLQDSPLLVRFDTVTDDSRCPADVECVWEGNATALVTIDSAGSAMVAEFTTSRRQPVVVFGWTFELRDLRPARTTTSIPRPKDYVITLRAAH